MLETLWTWVTSLPETLHQAWEAVPSDLRSLSLNILAAVIVAIFLWLIRGPLVNIGRPIARHLPLSAQLLFRRTADSLNWPAIVSETREDLHARILGLRRTKAGTFTLIGAIYLDITLRPIAGTLLEEGEFGDIESTHIDVGGSACWLGRYLHAFYSQKSVLITRLGARDRLFGRLLRQRLVREVWIKGRPIVSDSVAENAVSVHLEQADGTFRTTFTYRGALSELSWSGILPELAKRLRRRGVVYISGYFRTGLYSDLCASLSKLSLGGIVCIDHGRFRANSSPVQVAALAEAFEGKLIDVYLATVDELREYSHSFMKGQDGKTLPVNELLANLDQQGKLPLVTVVLDATDPSEVKVHSMVDGQYPKPIVKPYKRVYRGVRPGPRNAFSAGFVHQLASGPPAGTLLTMVEESAEHGLSKWAEGRL